MELNLENKRYRMDLKENVNETLKAFEQIQNFLNELSANKEIIELYVERKSGDMHNGPDENHPERKIVSSVNINDLFEDFFRIGDYDYQITIKPKNTGFKIETISTYNLSSCWLEQNVEVTTGY